MPLLHQSHFDRVTERPAYGIAAITQELTELRFPCSRQQVLDRFRGHETVHWSQDQTVDVRKLLDEADQERFEDIDDLVHACKRAAAELGLGEGGNVPAGSAP